jgi:hypothetical protein
LGLSKIRYSHKNPVSVSDFALEIGFSYDQFISRERNLLRIVGNFYHYSSLNGDITIFTLVNKLQLSQLKTTFSSRKIAEL